MSADYAPHPEGNPGPAQPAPGTPPDPARKRPKPGERREQILQTLALMLEQPGGERITTAALASRLGLSEAALYRHFASKAQMFEGLIAFIEQSVFTLINQITAVQDTPDTPPGEVGLRQCMRIVYVLIQFAEKNPGMARVMVGDALVLEHVRLQQRMNLFFDKVEASLRQALRTNPQAHTDAPLCASVLSAFAVGRLQRFVRSGFRQHASEHLEASLWMILR